MVREGSMNAYEKRLNELSPLDPNDEQWIIGGKYRRRLAWEGRYGTALRSHDPIAFRVRYGEYKRKIQ